ncbi:TRAFs-binding domain-containing protein [Novosphingobium mangrovi (ex Hu et al. 2023)]|uniref:DUF4071 domain-containing protein n=1 Tax=Novosphingobium mangrovi (ex Hu et al. 2023) TaxID=2930094 RepID=A0ABT0ACC5_9SPHN|nr:TRAFs-binding domain-containing protein [Novosphingobium mangrovi (ex Hu et al. 2023)]MCJ1960834.1 DUF4071 domain-containing protein [Novosphingobium mangrovi (ex Hu et al. 2023)]
MIPTLLTRIRQMARNGDTVRAWRMFESSGLAESSVPEVLALKGRLLKDRALRRDGQERLDLAMQAASAYRESAAGRRATYPLINAATIAYLCGNIAQARAEARKILAIIASGDHEPETPYWLQATVAEAQLLLGDTTACRAALLQALRVAPEAWEDRAATIRQLQEILQFSGSGFDVLEGLMLPPSLHFSGIMGLAEHEEAVKASVARCLDTVRPGAVFGALAAGTDIIVAELAVERGAQLHVVLPGALESFREVSVVPFGSQWISRFEAMIAVAHGVVELDEQDVLTRTGADEAAEIAMGMTIRRASQMAGEAIALHVGRAGEPPRRPIAKWKAQGRDLREIVRDWSNTKRSETLPPGRECVLLAADRPFAVAGDELGAPWESEEGYWLLDCRDLAQAMLIVREHLTRLSGNCFGLVQGSLEEGSSMVGLSQRAICFARAANSNEVCGAWPQMCAFDLLDAGVRFEPSGELVTPFGDIPVARYARLLEAD